MLAVAVACGAGASQPGAEATADRIVLVAARTFGDAAQLGALLDDMAAGTEVWGPARFDVLTAPGGLREFSGRLGAGDDLRAVIAVVGDLSVLDGVDPSRRAAAPTRRSSRVVHAGRIERELDALRAAVARHGATLVLATAPLGIAGRVEVPELLEVAELVRAHAAGHGVPLLDLQAVFAELEPRALALAGVDRLGPLGQQEVARALWTECLGEEAPLPPRDGTEQQARREAAALRAFAERRDDFEALARAALERPSASASGAVRQAALVSALDGPAAAAGRWEQVGHARRDAGAAPTGGTGAALAGRSAAQASVGTALALADFGGEPPADPVEAGLVEMLAALADAVRGAGPWSRAESLADELVAAHPDRLDAWIGLQLVHAFGSPPRDVRHIARRELGRFAGGALSRSAMGEILASWPRTVPALPAVVAATRPFARFTPDGPLMATARRRLLTHGTGVAAAIVEHGLEAFAHAPPVWRAELERLREAPRGDG